MNPPARSEAIVAEVWELLLSWLDLQERSSVGEIHWRTTQAALSVYNRCKCWPTKSCSEFSGE